MGADAVVVRLPLSVVKPMPASASLIEYGSSFKAFTLRTVSACLYLPVHFNVPPLVHLALLVGQHIGLTLKKLCAFFAVVLPQTRQVFYGLSILELCEVLLVVQVAVHLVEVARVSARLLLGVLSPDGRHSGTVYWMCCNYAVRTVSAAVGCCRAGWRIRLWAAGSCGCSETCRR